MPHQKPKPMTSSHVGNGILVDIHAKTVSLETIQAELRLHPWRLEERGCSVGKTPLTSAAEAGNVAVVEFLLSLGADMEAKEAVFTQNNITNATLVLIQLSNIPLDQNGFTALLWIARRGHSEVAQLLLRSGVNVHYKDGVSGPCFPIGFYFFLSLFCFAVLFVRLPFNLFSLKY